MEVYSILPFPVDNKLISDKYYVKNEEIEYVSGQDPRNELQCLPHPLENFCEVGNLIVPPNNILCAKYLLETSEHPENCKLIEYNVPTAYHIKCSGRENSSAVIGASQDTVLSIYCKNSHIQDQTYPAGRTYINSNCQFKTLEGGIEILSSGNSPNATFLPPVLAEMAMSELYWYLIYSGSVALPVGTISIIFIIPIIDLFVHSK